MKRKSKLLFVILLIIPFYLFNCTTEEITKKEEEHELIIYEPPLGTPTGQVMLQAVAIGSLGSEVLIYGTYEQNIDGALTPSTITSMYHLNADQDSALVQYYGNGKVTSYYVNPINGLKSNAISEFEKIDDFNFYYRVWDYNWSTNVGQLETESIVVYNSSSESFNVESTITGGRIKPTQASSTLNVLNFLAADKFGTEESYRKNDALDDWGKSFMTGLGTGLSKLSSNWKKVGAVTLVVAAAVSSPVVLAAGAAIVIAGKTGVIDKLANDVNNSFESVSSTTDSNFGGRTKTNFESVISWLKNPSIGNSVNCDEVSITMSEQKFANTTSSQFYWPYNLYVIASGTGTAPYSYEFMAGINNWQPIGSNGILVSSIPRNGLYVTVRATDSNGCSQTIDVYYSTLGDVAAIYGKNE